MEVESGEEPNAMHSRLLTKKQLSEMAWGVRELSKRLGSIRLKLKVRTVFILTKAHDEELIGNTRDMVRWLLSSEREVRYTVYVEDNLKKNKKFDALGLLEEVEKEYAQGSAANGDSKKMARRLRYWDDEMCRSRPHTFDFVITLGGDGTVLYASWLFQRIVPPVLSFALGSLGFLTKFDFEQYEQTLTKAFKDGVTISLRLRFEGTVMRSQKRKKSSGVEESNGAQDGDEERDLVEELVGEEKEDEKTHHPDGTYEILNDIVVDRGPNPSKLNGFSMLVVAKLHYQLCHPPRFSVTTSILLQSKQTVSVSLLQLAQQPIILPPEAPSATLRTQSFSSQQSAPIPSPFGPSFFPIP
jgi:NAD+ kinase